MHPAGRSRALAALLLALWLPGPALALATALVLPARGAAVALAMLAGAGLNAALLWRFWQRQALCLLTFDGQTWRLRQGRAATRERPALALQVALDLQSAALLRLQLPPEAGSGQRPITHWLWLARQRGPGGAASWHRLRCALYSPALAAGRA